MRVMGIGFRTFWTERNGRSSFRVGSWQPPKLPLIFHQHVRQVLSSTSVVFYNSSQQVCTAFAPNRGRAGDS
jgi:hypothetical protein